MDLEYKFLIGALVLLFILFSIRGISQLVNCRKCKAGCNSKFLGLIATDCKCPKECSKNGKCDKKTGICSCNPGTGGEDCSLKLCTPPDCNKQGICNHETGICDCNQGFKGTACTEITCPKNCSNHGTCDSTNGKCTCHSGYSGHDCSKKECPEANGKVCNGGNNTCNYDNGLCDCKNGSKEDNCSEDIMDKLRNAGVKITDTATKALDYLGHLCPHYSELDANSLKRLYNEAHEIVTGKEKTKAFLKLMGDVYSVCTNSK